MRWLMMLVLMTGMARAEGESAGDFDYYVVALSWSPTWCALEGDRRNSPQCDKPYGWVLHGLWPQYEQGWPSYCPTTARNPPRSETSDQSSLFGSSGNAWHQWNKHGRCTGLTATEYYTLAQTAFDTVAKPGVLRQLDDPIRLPASVIEDAFLDVNETLDPDQITVTCKANRIAEARLCMTQDLQLRRCGADVILDCTGTALLDPVRD